MTVAGTGHRPNKLGGYSPEASSILTSIAVSYLTNNRPDKVISGMALGWDQSLARAAIVLNIPFIAAIPFKGQELAWPNNSQQLYHWLLSKAEETVVVCEGGYAAWKMQKRNEYMVNSADVILAMYDGTSGGTANCVNYAIKQGKVVVNVYNDYKNYLHTAQ